MKKMIATQAFAVTAAVLLFSAPVFAGEVGQPPNGQQTPPVATQAPPKPPAPGGATQGWLAPKRDGHVGVHTDPQTGYEVYQDPATGRHKRVTPTGNGRM